jgi:hypothetical protein
MLAAAVGPGDGEPNLLIFRSNIKYMCKAQGRPVATISTTLV